MQYHALSKIRSNVSGLYGSRLFDMQEASERGSGVSRILSTHHSMMHLFEYCVMTMRKR